MSTVRELLDAFDAAISRIEQQKEDVIRQASPTFEHLPSSPPRGYANERYDSVYADGSRPKYGQMLTQRPAALRAARLPGRYIWDTRENVILDGEGNVVRRLG